eukprot:CAMPEP_0176012848 /NCGR_PEP_ID=MMETSP0120_2-20121206/6006_1 /TAXON_ID=160619 /ORGANISM="Kryptoperidinium foliaceum, Strain CCMP 1326" /LENGTH=919 /DNA_ID=CAMNT_0017345745 /DNA_START=80 /DNA_END=2839 /DNA_ORIENTATION=-
MSAESSATDSTEITDESSGKLFEDVRQQHHGSHALYLGMGQSGMDAMRSWRSLARAASRSRKAICCADSDSEEDDTAVEDDNEAQHDDRRTGGGLYAWSPRLYSWITARWTTTGRFLVLACFIALESAKFMQLEFAVNDQTHVNVLSIYFMACVLSFSVAVACSVILDGKWALAKIFSVSGLGRFFIAALLFILGTYFTVLAYKTGMSPAFVIMLSKMYLPVCAIGSIIVFKRRYTTLEWLSLGMLILGVTAFVLLRYQCHVNYCHELTMARVVLTGVCCMVVSILCSAPASIMAETVLKENLGAGLSLRERRNKYYICRAQLDFWMTLMTFACWATDEWIMLGDETPATASELIPRVDNLKTWFGHWTKRQYILVLILAAQSWFAGLMVQRFSTVSKGVAQSLATVFVVMLGDPMFNKYGMKTRFMPSLLITVIAVLSALIFQTGRLNVMEMRRLLRSTAGTRQEAPGQAQNPNLINRARDKIRSSGGISSCLSVACKYSVIIAYISADSFRSTILYVVQANRFFVPQTMAIASAVCGVAFASAMTLRSYGLQGLKSAWEPKKLQKFMVCGALQAVTTSLSSMAYALGTSPSMVVALGKVYTPLVAIFSRWILGKHFMWLEWFALIILTAASFTFGLMQDLVGQSDRGGSTALAGALCVVASAASSCLMSLLMEKLLKGDSDPFILQKVRLDFGSVLFSVAFLPVMGWLGTMPGNRRTDVAYWVPRAGPNYWGCQSLAMRTSHASSNGCDLATGEFLVNWTKVGNSTALQQQAAECICGSGVGVGWGTNYMIYVGLAAVVFHSWITGVLVSEFSSVYRAVADGVPVVLIYFLLDPLFSRVPLAPFQVAYESALPFPPLDWARDCICLILPLSGTTFSVASSEMQKVADLHVLCEEKDRPLAEQCNESTDSDEEGSSVE